MLLTASGNQEDVKTFLESEKARLDSVELLKHMHLQTSLMKGPDQANDICDSGTTDDDETDIGLRRPKALDLQQKDFPTGMDYVKRFIKETRVLHRGDAHNDERKAQSLGAVFQSDNKQPESLRGHLTPEELYLTAMIPILQEDYTANFQTGKKPEYTLANSYILDEDQVLGILTPVHCGQLPPVTIC